jgi:hypothetical protein
MLPQPASGTSTKTVIIEAATRYWHADAQIQHCKILWLRSLQFHLDPLIGCQRFWQNPDVS